MCAASTLTKIDSCRGHFQVGRRPLKTPKKQRWQGDPVWIEALRSALEKRPFDDAATLFHEQREDASVEWVSGVVQPAIDLTRSCGLAFDDPASGGRFVADPELADVERLTAPSRKGAGPVDAPAEGDLPALPVAEGIEAVELLAAEVGRRLERARVRARWVGFDQRVQLGRVGRPPVADERQGRRLRLEVRLERQGRRAIAVGELAIRRDAEKSHETAIEQLAAAVAERAEWRLAAETLPTGERPVVFAPGVGGILVHELVGHALEADTVAQGASWLTDKEFNAGSELTVLDDPRRGRAAWRFDDEGEAARATPLMRGGKVLGQLHDRRSATAAEHATTGHGRRSGFREPVRPRMGCTFMAAGRSAPGEVLEGIVDGVYVRRMEAASVDTRSGEATFRVTDADRIRHGRLVAPLEAHALHLKASAALASIDRIATDLEFDRCIGSCLHHGQPLSTSVGAPTFRIGSTLVVF
jgi:TldD protein